MSLTIANNKKKEWNKPKGTSITRVPEGLEDSLFISYFEGFYNGDSIDGGTGKDGIDLSTKKKQDMEKVANQHMEAAKLMMDKLGNDYDLTIYHLQDDCRKAVPLDNKKEYGIFFAEEFYVLDFKGKNHRYMVVWKGPGYHGDQNIHARSAMNDLEGGELSSDCTRTEV